MSEQSPTVGLRLGEEELTLSLFDQMMGAPRRALTVAAAVHVECALCVWRAAEEALDCLGDEWITRADLITLNPVIPEELEPHFLLALGEQIQECPRRGARQVR